MKEMKIERGKGREEGRETGGIKLNAKEDKR
jgi:hypothetical protein